MWKATIRSDGPPVKVSEGDRPWNEIKDLVVGLCHQYEPKWESKLRDAIDLIAGMMVDPDSPARLRLKCAEFFLSVAYPAPPAYTEEDLAALKLARSQSSG